MFKIIITVKYNYLKKSVQLITVIGALVCLEFNPENQQFSQHISIAKERSNIASYGWIEGTLDLISKS